MALFRDLLKKWFYTNSSQAASSDARIPLLDASGNPKGSDTMANIASVLGGVTKRLANSDDLNSFTQQGIVYVSEGGSITTTLANRPTDIVEAFIMFAPLPTTQIIITTWEGLKLYKRSYDDGWKKWQKVTGTEVEYAA